MDTRFQNILGNLEPLLEELQRSDLLTWDDLDRVPQRGIYVFYEGDKPIYTGRSRRMRQRIREHGAKSSRHESATFALKLLREAIGDSNSRKYTRSELQEKYPDLYEAQREKVRNMRFRVVKVEDSALQYVFEAYVIFALCTTRYNSFETT